MNWERVDLSADEFSRPSEGPVTCGLIYRGRRHALTGPPEAAKTVTALILGLEHMRGGYGSFALVDFEMGEHATRLMLDELGATADEVASVYYVAPEGPPDRADLDALVAAKVSLVVIDAAAGAYDVSALDDNKRADAERFGRVWVEPLWKLGVATVLIDHVVKNAESRGKFAIGSERKLGAVDVALGLESVKQLNRGGHGLIRILTNKDRPGHLSRPRAAELELTSDPHTHHITWAFRAAADTEDHGSGTDTFRPTVLMDRVLEQVNSPAYEPISRSALGNEVQGRREYVLKAVDCLLADGALALDGRKIVPVPRNVPRNDSQRERSHVPPSTGRNGNGERLPEVAK